MYFCAGLFSREHKYNTAAGPLVVDPMLVVRDSLKNDKWYAIPHDYCASDPLFRRLGIKEPYDQLRADDCIVATLHREAGCIIDGKFVCYRCHRLPDSSEALRLRLVRRVTAAAQGRPVVDERTRQQAGVNPSIDELRWFVDTLETRLYKLQRRYKYWKTRARDIECFVAAFRRGSPKVFLGFGVHCASKIS